MATRNHRLTFSLLWICSVPWCKLVRGQEVVSGNEVNRGKEFVRGQETEVCDAKCSLFSEEGGRWKISSVRTCPQLATSRSDHTVEVDNLFGWLRQFTRSVQPQMQQKRAAQDLHDAITAHPGGLTITVEGGTGRWQMSTSRTRGIWLISVSEEQSWLGGIWRGYRPWHPPQPVVAMPTPITKKLPCQLMSETNGHWRIRSTQACPQPVDASSQYMAEVDNLSGWLEHLAKRIKPRFGKSALEKLQTAITTSPSGLITTIEGETNRRHLMTRKSGNIWQAVYLPED